MAARAPSRRSWPGRDIPQNHQHAISIRQIMASLFALPPAVTAATARKPIFRLPCVQLSSAEGTAVKSASMKPMNTARMSARPRTNTRKKIRNASRVTRSWDRSAVLSSMKTLPRLARRRGKSRGACAVETRNASPIAAKTSTCGCFRNDRSRVFSTCTASETRNPTPRRFATVRKPSDWRSVG